jgi:DNA-binding IclR family transcriptional regulator
VGEGCVVAAIGSIRMPEAPRDDADKSGPAGGVQVISRAARILRALSPHRRGISLAAIVKEVGLPRSTVHRIIVAMEAEGLVAAASPGGGYRLGAEIGRMAADQHDGLRMELRPLLDELVVRVRETVALSILHDDQVSFIDQISVPHHLMAISGVGVTLPAHSTAAGKVLLATLGDDALRKLLPPRLEAQTENTITDREELLEQLAEIRVARVAYDRQEYTLGISAISALVHDSLGFPASISIAVPTARFAGNEPILTEQLLAACAPYSD